jgi:hypothetical protein
VIVAGSALAGIGAFVFVLVATRSLGLEGFSPISQLWTVWAIAAAVVTFSTQVVTVRREVLIGKTSISRSSELMPLVLLLLLVIPVLFLYRVRIFGESSFLWPIVGTLIPLGSYATGKARGWLAVHGSPTQLAGVVGGENLVRAGMAIILAFLEAGAIWYAVGILAGYSVALIGLSGRTPQSAVDEGSTSNEDRLLPLSASTAGICDHLLLVAAPTVLATSSGNPALVSALFVAMAVYRAPYQVVLGLVPSMTRRFTQRLPEMSRLDLRFHAQRIGLWTLLLTFVAGVVGVLLGEAVIAPIFGAKGVLDPVDHALAAALTVVATGALICSVALLALAQAKRTMATWIVVALLTIGVAYRVGDTPTAVLSVMLAGLAAGSLALGLPLLASRDGSVSH